MERSINLKKENKKSIQMDILTIVGISIVVWILHSIIHEVLGHGVATMLFGGKITFISTQWCMHTPIDSIWKTKLVLAAGPLANLAAVTISIFMLRSQNTIKSTTILFFWLLMLSNIFSFGSYMAGWFISPTFDWIKFIAGFEPIWIWKTIITITGCGFILFGIHIATKYWWPLIGTNPNERRKRIRRIALIPWITFILVSLSGIILFESESFPRSMMIWGAIGVAGHFNIWMLFLRFWPFKNTPEEAVKAMNIERNYSWIIIGLASLIFYIFIMGPGIKF